MDTRLRLFYPFARRFFAGTTLYEAVGRAKDAGGSGMGVTLDFLGEDVTSRGEALSAVHEYSRVKEAIHREGLDASVAVP